LVGPWLTGTAGCDRVRLRVYSEDSGCDGDADADQDDAADRFAPITDPARFGGQLASSPG
jgi:hypothetical protein